MHDVVAPLDTVAIDASRIRFAIAHTTTLHCACTADMLNGTDSRVFTPGVAQASLVSRGSTSTRCDGSI